MKLDKWQEDVLKTEGNLCICSGRQVGKSTVISMKAGNFAMNNPKKTIMVIASTERQAQLLFEKILAHIHGTKKSIIMKGKDRPTKHKLKLINGSVIHCLPTGDSGYGIRGFTIDALYADEAHFIGEEVWAAVSPMLATTGGNIILLSTPFGVQGYFYRCFHDKNFKSFHISTEEVAEGRSNPMKTRLKEFLKDEKVRMTKLQYQQEYLGLFVGGIDRFISDEQIDELCKRDPKENYKPIGDKFQGIDIARRGGDECPMISFDRIGRKKLIQFDFELPEPQALTDVARLIIHKDKTINHKKIYMDDGGLGVGVYDILYEDRQTKKKVVGLNNASREIERTFNHGKQVIRKKTLLGVDMSINFKTLIEQGMVELFDLPEIRQSLRSMQCDNSDGTLKIYGNYNHIFEALKRGAHCIKDKSLNILAFC